MHFRVVSISLTMTITLGLHLVEGLTLGESIR